MTGPLSVRIAFSFLIHQKSSSMIIFVLLQESNEGRRGAVRVLGLQQLHLLHQPQGRRSLGGRVLPNQRGPSEQSGNNWARG